jgi:GNAT superfamily N-acetyltransferase
MKIRTMTASDEQAVLEVVATLSDWFDDDARNRSIPIDLKHHTTFVADDAGSVVGFISLHVYNGRLDISWMGVRNGCRGRGIGTRLLHRAEKLGRTWGLHEITTFTLGDTVDYEPYVFTRRFYLKNGFEVYQRNRTDNPGCPEEWRLKKRITG